MAVLSLYQEEQHPRRGHFRPGTRGFRRQRQTEGLPLIPSPRTHNTLPMIGAGTMSCIARTHESLAFSLVLGDQLVFGFMDEEATDADPQR